MEFDEKSFIEYLETIPDKYIWYTCGGMTFHLVPVYMFKNMMPENTRSILPDTNNFSVMPDDLINREFYSLGATELICRLCIGDLESHLEAQRIIAKLRGGLMEGRLQEQVEINATELKVGDYFMDKKICMMTEFVHSVALFGKSHKGSTITFEDGTTHYILESSKLLIDRVIKINETVD